MPPTKRERIPEGVAFVTKKSRLEEEIEGIVILDKIRGSRKQRWNRFSGWGRDLWGQFTKVAKKYLLVVALLVSAGTTLAALASGNYGLVVLVAMLEIAWAIVLFVAKASVKEE